jgi:peptidoglycan/LPS O-acetylase OafA/YrhL
LLHYAQRLADPVAQTSVQIFFVISGFIITSLLLKERRDTGRISISAFYIRRGCRIIPALAAVLVTVAILHLADPVSLAMASTFTCNIGNCQWAVAHTWSLSVEEQYYLIWPALLVAFNPRPHVVAAATGALLIGFLIAPYAFHANYLSFACIGTGALTAMIRPRIPYNSLAWCAIALFLLLEPLYLPPKAEVITPFAIAYLLFGCPSWAKAVLAMRPFQVVGTASYSVYLWQQLFLGRGDALPLWGFPVVVALSVLLIERPFLRAGKRLSNGEYASWSSRLTKRAG